MNPSEVIDKVRSGVIKITPEKDGKPVGIGTGFLIDQGFITNYHVLPPDGLTYDVIHIQFDDKHPGEPNNPLRVAKDDLETVCMSTEDEHDFVYIKLCEKDFKERHVFELAEKHNLAAGDQVCFLGFPFGLEYLTAHMGHISSIHAKNNVEVFQIDGSINSGNSGGPLVDLETCKVVGIITRAYTGIIEDQFKELITTFRDYQNTMGILMKTTGMAITPAACDVSLEGTLKKVFEGMESVAKDLKRSANVGIGYAFSIDHVRIAIQEALICIRPGF